MGISLGRLARNGGRSVKRGPSLAGSVRSTPPEPYPSYFPYLQDLAARLDPPLHVVDVGCRWGEGEVWRRLQPYISLTGFDPDAAECKRLKEGSGSHPQTRFIPTALGPDAGAATLYLTSEPACSSLYPPDRTTIAHRPALSLASPAGTEQIQMSTLDEWLAGERMAVTDFIKVDTQGSELGVLQGAERGLSSASALEVEVEFNPIYEGQPLFGEVDQFLRRRGFVLWRFGNLVHYGLGEGRSDFGVEDQVFFDESPVALKGRGGQLFWCNAYYVAKGMAFRVDPVSWQAGLRQICISAALGFWDLAASTAAALAEDTPAELRVRVDAMIALARAETSQRS